MWKAEEPLCRRKANAKKEKKRRWSWNIFTKRIFGFSFDSFESRCKYLILISSHFFPFPAVEQILWSFVAGKQSNNCCLSLPDNCVRSPPRLSASTEKSVPETAQQLRSELLRSLKLLSVSRRLFCFHSLKSFSFARPSEHTKPGIRFHASFLSFSVSQLRH